MKCLVTGSEGFIGRNLVARLEQDGHEVIGSDVKTKNGLGNMYGSLSLQGPWDVIFHLACVNQMQAVRNPHENLTVNAFWAREMANLARMWDAKFIYTSTASVYGNAERIPTPVDAKLQPLTDYAVAKLAGEFFVQNSGADWTILRLSNVYGPHQTLDNPYCGVIGRFFEQARKGEPLTVIGSGMQTRDFTYVGDVVERLIEESGSLWQKGRLRISNVSNGYETTIAELANMISSLYKTDWRGGVEARPIDGIKRRCLIPDLACHTPLVTGLLKTKEWFDGQEF